MNILISYDYRRDALEGLPLEALARFVLGHEGVPDNAEVSISFVADGVIAGLNERYRGRPGPTDVLSFECDGACGQATAGGGPDDACCQLGDVVIAPDVAIRQTSEFDTTFEEEICLLLVHGLLHLCGYDHIEDGDAQRMEALEARLLEQWAAR